jgi:electron transfer flavoprotein beta subunit
VSVNLLVCVKRVPAPGGRINLTDDQKRIDTRHLGFTVSPHEECAIEEAVRIVEQHGGSATVLTLGPPEAEEQLRQALALGIDRAVLVETDGEEWDPQATASALVAAITTLEDEAESFDLLLFGNESADAGHHQVGVRIAHALRRPIVSGIKGVEIAERSVVLRREIPDGYEVYELDLPAAAAVKEGLNLPRYPSIKGRLRAKNAEVRRLTAEAEPGGLRTRRLVHPPQQETETIVLGDGPDAAGRVVDTLEELGVL